MVDVEVVRTRPIVLHGVDWETYERLLREHADASAPRYTYDRGTLEIMSPLAIHERINRLLQLLLPIIAEGTGADLCSLGSTTFSREDLQRGFEPDSCFYIANEAKVRGKERIDLHVDPPPDLVFEVHVTHSTLDKLAIYAQLGVPEVWRYNGERFQVLILAGDHYTEQRQSQAFPMAEAAALALLFRGSITLSDMAWIRRARTWVRTLEPGTAI
ncbi:MAG: Uma2 family endonuclease [Chloroflexota bacterium]